MQDLRGVLPAPVQVLPAERAPVVAVDNAVWVHHRDNFEDEVVSERLGLGRVADEELDDTFHHPGRVALARMHSGGDEDALLGPRLLAVGVLVFRGDRNVLAPVACKSPAQRASVDKVGRESIPFDARQIILKVRVGEGEAVSEVDLIVVVLESVSERQSIVEAIEPRILSLQCVLVVVDVMPDSVPGEVSFFLPPAHRIAEDPHAVVVEGVGLGKVEDVELDRHAFVDV